MKNEVAPSQSADAEFNRRFLRAVSHPLRVDLDLYRENISLLRQPSLENTPTVFLLLFFQILGNVTIAACLIKPELMMESATVFAKLPIPIHERTLRIGLLSAIALYNRKAADPETSVPSPLKVLLRYRYYQVNRLLQGAWDRVPFKKHTGAELFATISPTNPDQFPE